MISNVHKATTPLYGLVLAGGKSLRMGQDKSIIKWHGREQRYHMADMLRTVCDDVIISCRPEQQSEIDPAYKTVPDSYPGSGPLVAILSALAARPAAAWLVAACDLPLMDADTLRFLIGQRDIACIATTFESPFDALPEPLITIWEPAANEVLLAHSAEGFTCPRKALIRNSERVKIIQAPNPSVLMNANTPEDAEKVRNMIVSMGK